MLLKNLIKDIPIKNKKINVKGLAINSKKIKKGYIFFAIKGLSFTINFVLYFLQIFFIFLPIEIISFSL